MQVRVECRLQIRAAEDRLRRSHRLAHLTEQRRVVVLDALKALAEEATLSSSASDQPRFGY